MKQTLTIPVYMNTTVGAMATREVRLISPMSSRRIGRMWVNRSHPKAVIPFGAAIAVDVNGREVLPRGFPLRWLCADHYILDADYNPSKLRLPSDHFAIPVDQKAQGSEIVITVSSDVDVIISIEFDDLDLQPSERKYKVVDINPSWQADIAAYDYSYNLDMLRRTVPLQLDYPLQSVFADWDVQYPGSISPYLTVGKFGSLLSPKLIKYIGYFHPIKYGYLYNLYTVYQGDGDQLSVANVGFRVPSDDDFHQLILHLDPNALLQEQESAIAGGILMGKRLSPNDPCWISPNPHATNGVNFNAYGAGFRSDTGDFHGRGLNAIFWTRNPDYYTGMLYVRRMGEFVDGQFGPQIERLNLSHLYGYSIRLMRDASAAEQLLNDGSYCTPYVGNDGKAYRTVKIGSQVWMADNLAETKFYEGIPIVEVTGNQQWGENYSIAKRCSYNNIEANALYLSNAIKGSWPTVGFSPTSWGGERAAFDHLLKAAKISLSDGTTLIDNADIETIMPQRMLPPERVRVDVSTSVRNLTLSLLSPIILTDGGADALPFGDTKLQVCFICTNKR